MTTKQAITIAMILTFIFQTICIVMFIIGKFTFYQFITSITLLDILHILENRELKESEG